MTARVQVHMNFSFYKINFYCTISIIKAIYIFENVENIHKQNEEIDLKPYYPTT